MFKKWLNKKSMFLVSLIVILTVSVGGSLAYLYDKTDTFINTFKYDHTGDLVIDKVVNHLYGSQYIIPDGINFEFNVELGSEFANKEIVTSNGNVTCDANGVANVTVLKDSEVIIKDLPLDTSINVTEVNLKPGFTVNGGITQTLVITSKERNVVTFRNDYQASSVSGNVITINGTKELDREWIAGDNFTFKLSKYNGTEWIECTTTNVSYGSSNTFNFNDYINQESFSEVGTYRYKVSEVEGTIPGISYDHQEAFIDIIVTDEDMDGSLEIKTVKLNNQEITNNQGIYNVAFVFTNIYAPIGSDLVTIHITKTLEDLSGQNKTPEGFIFELKDTLGNVIKTSDETSSVGETSIVLPYDPTTAGNTYEYVVTEKNLGQKGMTYDEKVYSLEISVVDNLDGTVSAYVYDKNEDDMIPDGTTNTYNATFKNTYDPIDASSVSFSGKKVLDGRLLKEEEFTFELYDSEGNIVDTATNDSEGNFTLETSTFSTVGIYEYVIKEKQETLGGITYSTKEYKVRVTVIDEDGTLKATPTLIDVQAIEFTNIYTVQNKEYIISGSKELLNYELEESMFTFEMYEADENFAYEENNLIRLSKNKSDGTFTFDTFTYKKVDIGTKYYVVKEKSEVNGTDDFKSRIDYDDTNYGIVLTITDDLEGGLKIEEEIINLSSNQTVNEIKFINTYTPPAEDIDITVDINKTVENKGEDIIGPEGFTFVLTENGKEVGKVQTDENGQATINITYSEDEVGIHTYILKEVNDGKKYVTYDEKEYEIIVEVVLTEDNKLVVTYKVNGENTDTIDCSFVNIYDYTREEIQTSDINTIIPLTCTLLVSAVLLVLLKKREQLRK